MLWKINLRKIKPQAFPSDTLIIDVTNFVEFNWFHQIVPILGTHDCLKAKNVPMGYIKPVQSVAGILTRWQNVASHEIAEFNP
jgi:hypothetical protein